MSTDETEYVLHELTVHLISSFEERMDAFARREDPEAFQAMAREIHEIDNFDKGRVIIDLLTLLATAMRSLVEHELPSLDAE